MSLQPASSLIRVLVADNSRIHTELLADALRRDTCLQVITSQSASEGLIEQVDEVDVFILGSNLDGQPNGGAEVLRRLRTRKSDVRAVMLLDSSKSEVILEAFRAGAKGVFGRHESVEILSKCARRVHEGQIWADSRQLEILLQSLSSAPEVRAVDARGVNLLSKREMEVAQGVARGLTNREIAERLNVSQHTVKNHLFRLFDKLGVSNRVELLFLTLSQEHPEKSAFHGFLENQDGACSLDEETLVACQKAADQGALMAQLALAQYYSARGASPSEAMRTYMWYSVVGEQVLRACEEANHGMTMDQLLEAEQMKAEWVNRREKISLISGRQAVPLFTPGSGHAASAPA